MFCFDCDVHLLIYPGLNTMIPVCSVINLCSGLMEGASTHLLVHTGKLIARGVGPVAACKSANAEALTDFANMLWAVNKLGASLFKPLL